jgi:Tfp pilus assembly protein FimT
MTAVELLTLVVLLVILAAFAIPSISPVVLRQRLSGAAWQLGGDLRLARQRAVTERKRFRVCLTSCAISVPAGSYSIEREDGTWVSDTGAPVRLPQDVTLCSTGTATFSTSGMSVPGSTFTLRNILGIYQITVASTGRVQVCKGTCSTLCPP